MPPVNEAHRRKELAIKDEDLERKEKSKEFPSRITHSSLVGEPELIQ